jgi:hypothetical protein
MRRGIDGAALEEEGARTGGQWAQLTSRHFLSWREERKILLIDIQPGRADAERPCGTFNAWLRDQYLNASSLHTLGDARSKIATRRDEYTGEPQSSLGYRRPNEFAKTLKSSVIAG